MVSSRWLLPGPTGARLPALRIAVLWCAILTPHLRCSLAHADELHLADCTQPESLVTIANDTGTFRDEEAQAFNGGIVNPLTLIFDNSGFRTVGLKSGSRRQLVEKSEL